MTRSDADFLLDAVHALTRPRTVKWIQENAHGISCTNSAVQDALLDQLRDAVVGGIGSKGGGGGEGGTRLPFNAGALELYDEIEREMGEEYHRVTNRAEFGSPQKNLDAWMLAVINARRTREGVTEHYEKWWTRQLETWAHKIRAMFDPSILIEISEDFHEPIVDDFGQPKLDRKKQPRIRKTTRPAACPKCGERHAFDPTTGDQITALVLRYFNRDGEVLDGAVAQCRFCQHMWAGEGGMRQLRQALETSGGGVAGPGVFV